jgi:hypothetical protein
MRRIVPSQLRQYLAAKFHGVPASDFSAVREGVGHLAGFIELFDAVPDELIRLRPDEFQRLVSAVATIRFGVKKFQNGDSGDCLRPAVLCLPVILELLEKLQDQTSSTLHELSFITDEFLQESIGLDLAAISTSLHSGEWKGATILAGSCCEALLLYGLQQSDLRSPGCIIKAVTKIPGTPLNANDLTDRSWDLWSYTQAASNLDLILNTTKKELEPAREYRNLIHPAKSVRERTRFDRGTALVGAGALEHVVRDLKKSLQ